MNALRDELGGSPSTSATPYTLLCPPGWRRMPAAALADDAMTAPALAQLKGAGRADLVLQFRGLLTRYRAAIRESGAFQVYLAPTVDGIPLPATILVSPFVLPSATTWDAALLRLGRGSAVEEADFTETRMWVWSGDERMADDAAVMVGRSTHYLVPTPEDGSRRALHFQLTVLVADSPETRPLVEPLLATGDLIMSTMRWVDASASEVPNSAPRSPRSEAE